MYQYSGLDKVASISEGEKVISSYQYSISGQLASATTDGTTENFLWDGLALIRRGDTDYTNEPYVTGGNPVVAGDKVLFNDILGNTVGIKSEDKLKLIQMTAFGETADKNAFFTGKPAVNNLGYSFIFRNYRADQGKWLSQDPTGYPDGWNNLAYCNSRVTSAIDKLGMNIYELLDRQGAGGYGHSLPIATVQNSDGSWTAAAYGYGAQFGSSSGSSPSGTSVNNQTFTGSTEQEAVDKAVDTYDPQGNTFDNMYGWQTSNAQSEAAMAAMGAETAQPYNLTNHNCLSITKAGLEAANMKSEDTANQPNEADAMRKRATDFTNILKGFQKKE